MRLLLIVALVVLKSIAGELFHDLETATNADFVATKIDVTICVKDEDTGDPILFPSLMLTSWSGGTRTASEANGISSSGQGCFDLTDIPRGAVRIKIEAPDYYTSITPVDLHIPTSIANVNLGIVALTKKRDGVARLVFGGDVMFERRFFDKELLNLGASLEDDTRRLFHHIQPFLEASDHANVNLECPIVEDRSTPHPKKNIVFGCHRESAQALPHVGVDSVTIANNHLYDYLEIGTQETMTILDDVGMPWFGGGMTRQEARDSLYRFNVSGTGSDVLSLSFQGFTNFFDYAQGDEYTTFADSSPVVKGGAMPAFIAELQDFVQEELELQRIPIPIIHGGTEYSLKQDNGMRSDFQTSAMAGAKLIIAHHPHVVHGVTTFRAPGDAKPIFIVGSLGNLVFDQDLHETFPGYLAVVDMSAAGEVKRLELVPLVLEGYVPRPITISGDSTAQKSALLRAARRIAHLSTTEALSGTKATVDCPPPVGTSVWVKQSGCGFGGAVPFVEKGKILVVASESEVNAVDTTTTHSVVIPESSSDSQILAVHEHHSDESSLARLEASSESANLSCDLGVDLLRVGGFEAETAGDYGPKDYPLPSLWSTSKYRYIQSTRTRTGTGAAVLLRTSTNKSRTSLCYDRRVDVIPGSKITVRGFFAMENAGKFVVAVYFTDELKATRYETGSSFTHLGGDVPDWTEFNIYLEIPSDVVKIKAYLRQSPPEEGGEGRVFIDDLSFIQWDSVPVSLASPGAVDLATPNGWEFVRCRAQEGSLNELNVDMTMTGRTYQSQPTNENTASNNGRNLRA